MIVGEIVLRDFRSYARQDLLLAEGLTLIVGPNGAGKTNLLDAVHFGTQGFSLRTRRDARVVRLGAVAARVAAKGSLASGLQFSTTVTVEPGDGKRIVLNGAALTSADDLRKEFPVLVFTPDRLAVVKGGPAVRRSYLDRMIGRVLPSRAALPGGYGQALAQRNAALRRVKLGLSGRTAIGPWSETLSRLGNELEDARAQLVAALAPHFAAHADALGLPGAALGYEAAHLSVADLERRLDQDIARAATGVGPHLRDVAVTAGNRELRAYGSQGEQRLVVLALLLGEAELLVQLRGEPALLLLDDVLSELDDRRRRALLRALPSGCQTLVTATALRSLPDDMGAPSLVVDVAPGRASPR